MKVNGNAPQTRRRLLLLNEDAPICLTAPRLSTSRGFLATVCWRRLWPRVLNADWVNFKPSGRLEQASCPSLFLP